MASGSPDLSFLGQATWFNAGGASVAALLLLRLTGLLWMAPLFSGRMIPGTVRTALAVVLAALLWPAAVDAGGATAARLNVATVLVELGVGLTLGLGAAVFVGAAESAGDTIAVQMGLSGANVVDPSSQTQLPVLGQLLGLFATMLILSTGGHVVILRALHASLELVPPGQPVDVEHGALAVVALGGRLLSLGLQFAAPVVAAMMMANAALGVLARTVPQLNILMVAFPIQIAVGLFVLAATLPVIASTFAAWPDAYGEVAGGLLDALVPAGGRRWPTSPTRTAPRPRPRRSAPTRSTRGRSRTARSSPPPSSSSPVRRRWPRRAPPRPPPPPTSSGCPPHSDRASVRGAGHRGPGGRGGQPHPAGPRPRAAPHDGRGVGHQRAPGPGRLHR
ncbi:MAG: flagellar biosynthetic protein FliR [Gemmatimonadetes bacterium]|nr:flagellar biosynthetic protein FliR [Gemmatimonadota bacterium]